MEWCRSTIFQKQTNKQTRKKRTDLWLPVVVVRAKEILDECSPNIQTSSYKINKY